MTNVRFSVILAIMRPCGRNSYPFVMKCLELATPHSATFQAAYHPDNINFNFRNRKHFKKFTMVILSLQFSFPSNQIIFAKNEATCTVSEHLSLNIYSIILQIDRRNIRPINFRDSHFIYNLNLGSTFYMACY